MTAMGVPTLPSTLSADLLAALRAGSNAVLVAPPGAGKTTAVAPALLGEPWCTGEILLLSPRRLAARAAAERMAELAGEPVGGTIGYATRLDSKRSARDPDHRPHRGHLPATRIQADPELAGVSAVLFDEVHERSLDSDFGLALALDAQAALRPDLRLVAMSATLDGARFAALMGGAPVIESEGRSHPDRRSSISAAPPRSGSRTRWPPRSAARLAESEGGLLAFLPGVAEIERTAERLDALPADVDLHRLHGSLDPAAQRAAIAPSPPGRRKLVLATSIAETSLTLDGVRIVVDSGLARRPRYDRAAGLTRLVTERASQAAVDPARRPRRPAGAGPRLPAVGGGGDARACRASTRPKSWKRTCPRLLLDCALWGVADPRALALARSAARRRGRRGAASACAASARSTKRAARPPHGRAIAALPLPPRLAHMLIEAAARGWARDGGRGGGAALRARPRRQRRRSRAAPAALARREGQARRGRARPGAALARLARSANGKPAAGRASAPASPSPSPTGSRSAATPPARDWISVGGRGFRLDPASPLAREPWLAVAEVGGAAAGARILAAAPIDQATVEALFADRIASGADARLRSRHRQRPRPPRPPARRDPALGRPGQPRRSGRDRGGSARRRPRPRPRPAALERGRPVAAHAAPPSPAATIRPLPIFPTRRCSPLDDWLPLAARRQATARRGRSRRARRHARRAARLGRAARRSTGSRRAHFETPAGSRHAIDYEAEAGPTVTVRVQALFGLAEHPQRRRRPARPLPDLARRPADPDHARPARLLARQLGGGREGDARPLSRNIPGPTIRPRAPPTLRTKKASARNQ